ncbi:hypothetical protein BD310DRAFT_820551, partial [Dichomitus squalens]
MSATIGDPHPLPSASSTPHSPMLPWEVIERAIDHCSGDKTTLCAFALTCSQLHPRSLFVLFTDVHLRSTEQLTAFYHAVRAQPRLQPVVQSLSFPWNDFSPFPLLSILPGLRHVAFDTISSVNTDGRQISQLAQIGGRPFAASLRSLTIRGTSFPMQTAFLNFISAFPNIENLTCEHLDFHMHGDTPTRQELYPTHRVLLTALGGPVLNVRKTISWSDEFSRLFRPLGEKWALTEDVRY